MSWSVFGFHPFPDSALFPRGWEWAYGHRRGSSFAFCTKHKSGQPLLWPAPFLRALNWRTYPGPIFLFLSFFFFWGKKNYAIVYTPGCIWRRGISVLKCPECLSGLFFCMWISLLRYVLLTHLMEWHPHICSKPDVGWVCVYVFWGPVIAIYCFCPIRKVVIPCPPRLSSSLELLRV